MASKFRNLYDADVQDRLSNLPVPPDSPDIADSPQNDIGPPIDIARAQTLARSSRNPAAQQIGQAMLAENDRQQKMASRKAEYEARKAEAQAARAQREQDAEVEAERERSVREAAAQGAKTITDVETGKRSIATHPDGSPVSEAGPIGKPFIQPTAEAALSSVPGMGSIAQLNRPANKQTLDQTTEVAQQYRNDRFQTTVQPLPSDTDPKTGLITGKLKDEFGAPQTVQLGVDQTIQADTAKKAEFAQRKLQLDSKKNAVAQTRLRFDPQWEPVKKEFDDASKHVNSFTESSPFIQAPDKSGTLAWYVRNPKTGAAKLDELTQQPIKAPKDELAYWQQQKADAENRLTAAKEKHDKMLPTAENLNRNETEIADAQLKLTEEKIRHDAGLELQPMFTSFSREKAVEGLKDATPENIDVVDKDGKAASIPVVAVRTHEGKMINIPMVTETGKPLDKNQALKQFEESGKYFEKPEGNPLTRKLANMDIEAERVKHAVTTGKVDPEKADMRLKVIAEMKGQTIEQAKAEAKARLEQATAEAKATLEAKGREIAAGFVGQGNSASNLAGVKIASMYEGIKGDLNEVGSIEQRVSNQLSEADGDIDKAIAAVETPKRRVTTAEAWGFPFAGSDAKVVSSENAETGKRLRQMKAALADAGVDPKDNARIIKDAASTTAWTGNDTDNIRKLSTGDLVINPGRVFGQKDALVAEIKASNSTPQQKQSALTRLDAMRKDMATEVDATLEAADSDAYLSSRAIKDIGTLGMNELRDGYREFVDKKQTQGMTDKVAILDEFMASEKNRNALFKLGNVIETGLSTGAVGGYKTVVGLLAQGAALTDKTTGIGGDMAASLGQHQMELGQAIQGVGEASNLRGVGGNWAFVNDAVNSITQMLPMFAGGELARGLEGFAQIATMHMAVDGWAAAQGWESATSSILNDKAQKKGSDLSASEIVATLQEPKTIIAALADAVNTAAVNRLMPGGAERAAGMGVAAEAEAMTIRQFIAGGGERVLRDGTFRKEISMLFKNVKHDMKSEFLEELTNQMLEDVILAKATDQDIKLGDAISNWIYSGTLGGFSAVGVNQVGKNFTKQKAHLEMSDALRKQMFGEPDASMISTALASIDPQAKAPDSSELKQARKLVAPNIDSLKALEEKRKAYDAAIKAKDYKAAKAIDEEISQIFTDAHSSAATDTAKAVMLHRELVGLGKQASEATWNADEALTAAKMSGDKTAIAQAEANLEQVLKSNPNVALVSASVKLATGHDISTLTDPELRSVGFKPGDEGTYEPMSPKELADAGLSKPLVRAGADGSPIILDEAVEQVKQTSPNAAARIKLDELDALQAARERRDAANASQESQPPVNNEPHPQRQTEQTSPPENPQPAPAKASAPDGVIPDGGKGTPAAIPRGAGPQLASEKVAEYAASDAAIYTAAREQNPELPSIPDVVEAAKSAGHPVSESMARAAEKQAPSEETPNTDDPIQSKKSAILAEIGKGNPVSTKEADAAGVKIPSHYHKVGEMYRPKEARPERPIIDPATKTQAKALIERLKSALVTTFPKLKDRVTITDSQDIPVTGGVLVNLDGTLGFHVSDVAMRINEIGEDAAFSELELMAIRHELRHIAQVEVVRDAYNKAKADGYTGSYTEFWNEYYGAIHQELLATPKLIGFFKEIYDEKPVEQKGFSSWDQIDTDSNKAAEGLRILMEIAESGSEEQKAKLSELARANIRNSPKTVAFLESVIAKIKELLGSIIGDDSKLSDAVKKHMKEVEDFYQSLLENTGPKEISDDLDDSRRIVNEAISDAFEKDKSIKSDEDLRITLVNIAFDIADVMEGIPPDERRAFIDQSIADWLSENAEKIKQSAEAAAQAEEETGKPQAAREKAKAARQAYQARINSKAREILNSGDFSVLSSIFEKGTITPKPNVIGLILARKKKGAKLTEREMAILRPHKEGGHWDGMPRKQDYPGGGNNAVIRAIIDLIMAPTGQGQMPHKMGTDLGKGITDASSMWEAVSKAFRAISKGTTLVSEDPDSIETPENIAKAEAANAEAPVTMQTLGDKAREEFGSDSAVARKIELFDRYADRLTDQMEEVILNAMQAEVGRTRAGVISPVQWQEQTNGWNDTLKAVHKAIASHTPESLEAWLKSRPVVDEEEPMFSSPASSESAGNSDGNNAKSPHGTDQGQATHSEGNLRAEQLVSRAKEQTGRSEQPAYPAIGSGYDQGPWARPDRPSALSEIDRQDDELYKWAQKNGHFVDPGEVARIAQIADKTFGGQEHDVWAFTKGGNPIVIRRTRNGGYGLRDRTPGEYIKRWQLSNKVFPDTAVSLIGYTKDRFGNGIILTSQRYFEGTKKPQKVIDSKISELGFEQMAGGEPSYRNPQTKVEIHDAKPDNIIFDKAGNMHPFDVWINDPDNYFGVAPTALFSSAPSFDFGAPLDATTKDQKGFDFDIPAGPLAKFQANAQKAMDNATNDKARENIAARVAEKEGLKDAKPYVKAAIGGQAAFDFGTTGSFDTKNQMGFDFGGKPTTKNENAGNDDAGGMADRSQGTEDEMPNTRIPNTATAKAETGDSGKNSIKKTQPDAGTGLSGQVDSQREEGNKKPFDTFAPGTPKGINDFGEKLDIRKNRPAAVNANLSDGDMESMPFSKIWPKADVDAIEDAPLAAMATVFRESVPAKPRDDWKVQRWIGEVKVVQEFMRIANEIGAEAALGRMENPKESSNLNDLASKIRILSTIPRPQWDRISDVRNRPNAVRFAKDENGNWDTSIRIPAPYAEAKIDGKRIDAVTFTALAEKVQAAVGGETEAPRPGKPLKFEVRFDRVTYYINKKGDPLRRSLASFETSKEAFDFIKNQPSKLAAEWDAIKERENVKKDDVRGKENRPRQGQDWRNGKDATPEMFEQAFGFRGVAFGKWVEQGGNARERQGMFNLAYDSFMDLAKILGVPPKAMSLEGTLGLAFGADGSGSASAHYNPQDVHINLTKTRGAGVLAHEFFHAMDNYFQKKRPGKSNTPHGGDYITFQPETYYQDQRTGHRLSAFNFHRIQTTGGRFANINDWKRIEGVRPEVEERFTELVKALDASPMAKRAKAVDKGKDGYWSQIIERAARSFENYVIHKMMQDGYHNDYLANVTKPESFVRDQNLYPYLLESEVAPVAEAFDNLFGTIQTEETDKGVRLFSSPPQLPEGNSIPDIPNWNQHQDRLKAAESKEQREEINRKYHEDYPESRGLIADRSSRKIPPGWVDVTIFPEGSIVPARGKDSKGRPVSVRTSEADALSAAKKFARAKNVNQTMPQAIKQIGDDLESGESPEESSVLRLIYLTGFRNGGDSDTGAKVKAYGASTLRAEHVEIDGDTVTFDFIGKLGVRQQHTIINAPLARDLEERKSRGGALFNTNATKVLARWKRVSGNPEFIVHDLRTWNATELATELVKQNESPTNPADFWLLRDQIGDIVALKLGDTRSVVLESYIDPIVFAKWRDSASIGHEENRPKISRRDAENRGSSAQLGRTTEEYGRSLRDELLPPGSPTSSGTTARRGGGSSGLTQAALLSSPAFREDLFTAASTPDAAEKLGQVKVGTMNALAAYRTLTARREAGKTLTGKEEQQLLDAEQALGQKMAFDMEGLKGDAPAVTAKGTVTPRPVLGQKITQQSMFMGPETTKDGQMSLLSSSPESDPVQIALSKMSPIFADVYHAVESGMAPEEIQAKFNVTPKAITNILNQVRSRVVIAQKALAGNLKPEIDEDGKFVDGRPDLAYGANPDFVAVDQIRNESNIPDVVSMEENYAEADRRLATDYEGEFSRLEGMAQTGERPDRIDIAIAKQIFRREALSGGLTDPQRRARVAMFQVAYREQGAEQGRALQMRRDEAFTPAERNALSLAQVFYEPSPQVQSRMAGSDEKTREAIIKQWMDQIDAFKAELKADGVDVDASMAAWQAHRQGIENAEKIHTGTKEAMDKAFMKLDKREKMIIQLIRDGSKLSTIIRQTGMTQSQIMDVKTRFGQAWKQAIIDAGKRFAANSLASSSPQDVYDMVMSDLGWQTDDDFNDLAPDYLEKQDQKRKDAKKKANKKTPAAPQIASLTPKQQEALDAAWERFQAAPLSTWATLFQTEKKNLGPLVGQKSFKEWTGEILKPWRDLWQTEMNAINDPAGRISFEQWLGKPPSTWTAKQSEMFESVRLPINETRGTFDMNDPIATAALMSKWEQRNGAWSHKLTEAYKMYILSGVQTALRNSSGAIFAVHELGPKRAIEAGWNDIMSMFGAGDVRSATLSEFLPMLKNVRAAMSLGARIAASEWRIDGMAAESTFDTYAKAQSIQINFNGSMGEMQHAPALHLATWQQLKEDTTFRNSVGFVHKFLRNITFRELGAVDGFVKGVFAQLDVAALSHRIAAKEEGLSGKAYTARVEELMKPGSMAWQRNIDRTKRATFQDSLAYGKWTAADEKKNPNHREGQTMKWGQALKKSETESAWTMLDALAAKTLEARKIPFIGPLLHMFALPFIQTPKNIVQRGLEIAPLGIPLPLGTVVDIIDGMRSLRRRIYSGQITKEESNRIAGELYNKTRFVQTLTNQTISTMIYLAVESLLGGDDDDDKYGRPHLTGTMPYDATKKGERDNAQAVMPPQSIRIGDTVISYAGIEPIATMLSATADLIESHKRNGTYNAQVVTDSLIGMREQFTDKLFLQGLGNIIQAIRNPDRFGDRLMAGWVTGFIPNIVRQPIREVNKFARDTNPKADDGFFTAIGKRVGFSVVPQFAPIKLDVWGNPIPTNRGELIGGSEPADSLFRIFDPLNVRKGGEIQPIDAWIYHYNASQPDRKQRIGIEAPSDEVTIRLPDETNSRKVALTAQEYAESVRNVGQAAKEVLGDDWDWRTAKDADAYQKAERIKDVFTKLKRRETQRLKIEKTAEAMGKQN